MYIENYLLRKTFENRGYDQAFLDTFDDPSISRLGNLDEMLDRLKYLHDTQSLIVQTPDYDMDGIMSGVTGLAGLSELGFRVALMYLRPQDGYGFDAKTIQKVMLNYPDAKAILTSDTGITCFEGVNAAKAAGLTVLLTDHHKPGPNLPDADCIVNPMVGDAYEHPAICGTYVVYQVLQAYADKYGSLYQREQIRRLRVFAGIGTISDSMPLRYENRQIVRDAAAISELIFCNGSSFVVNNMPGTRHYRSAFRGLYETYVVLRAMKKLDGDIDEVTFGYYMAPMFNSVKRMNGDISRAYGVFFGPDPVRDVNYLYDLNDYRKEFVKDALEKCLTDNQPYKPYVYFSEAHEGVLGLLAQKISDQEGCPVCVVRRKDDGIGYKGSGRAQSWYPFLTRTSRQRLSAAGHETAFGVNFEDDAAVAAFYDFMKYDVADALKTMPSTEEVKPDFVIDHNGSGDTVINIVAFLEYMAELERLKPFGPGFAEPNIMLRFRPEEAEWKAIGSVKQHLKLVLPRGLEVLCWDQANKLSYQSKKGKDIVVMGKLGRSVFRDIETVNFTGTMLDM